MTNRFFRFDWVLLSSVTLLTVIGLSVLYSISNIQAGNMISSVFFRQLVFTVLSLAVMLFFAFNNYHYLRQYSTGIYFVTILVLILVLIFGTTVRGTSGWLGFGLFRIQPVEISKIALVIFLASFISQKRMEFGEVGRIVVSFLLTCIIIFLVIKQPDFGSAMVLLSIWVGMILVSGVSKKLIFVIAISAITFGVIAWFQMAQYQKDRINSFLDPASDPMGSGYNVRQAMVAVGSGGLIGKGIGHGSQSQLNFLPEKHTDFIFASIAEELGFVGSAIAIFLFGVLFYRIREIAMGSVDNFGFLLAVGFLVMFFVQTFINIGMNIGIVPVTGIPLPFLSYGGSSLISVFISIGIILNVYSKKELSIKDEWSGYS